MVLRRDLEQAGECLVVLVDARSYALGDLYCILATVLPMILLRLQVSPCIEAGSTYVLIDKHNGNILPLPSELVESLLDSCVVRLAVYDEVVLLRLWGFGDML